MSPVWNFDVVQRQVMCGATEFQIQPAQRRAAITADETGGTQPHCIALRLQHRQPHQRLDAGDEHAAVVEAVFVVKRKVVARCVPASVETRLARLFRAISEKPDALSI